MSPETRNVLLGAFLGWLLGLLGQRLVEMILNSYRRKEIRRALGVELGDLCVRLALSAAAIRFKRGGYDVEFIRWFRPIVTGYTGFYASSEWSVALDAIEGWGDEQIKENLETLALAKGDTGLELSKLRAPFLTTKVEQLALFSPAFQQKALEVVTRLEIINEKMDAAWFYMTKTFDPGLDEATHANLRNNAGDAYSRIAQMSKDTADMIGQLLEIDE